MYSARQTLSLNSQRRDKSRFRLRSTYSLSASNLDLDTHRITCFEDSQGISIV